MATKIVNGKKYDTDKAECIATASYSHPGDFSYWCESLYVTPGGAFFVDGEGGPMSHYSRSTGQNEWSGGSDITPMTKAEALAWCEENNIKASVIEKHFAVQDA